MTSTALSSRSEVAPPPHAPSRLGVPFAAVVALVALTIPRVIAHDLALVAPGSLANSVLSLGPLAVWVLVAALASRRPFSTLVATGIGYGLVLGTVHNLAWSTVWAGSPPRLGGSLAGAWSPGTEEILMRGATGLSSLGTGAVTGIVAGAIAWAVQELARRNGARLPLR